MDKHPLWVFGTTFSISSVAGLAALLRSGKPLTWRATGSAMLNSGLLGLAIAFVWWEWMGADESRLWFVMGVSLLAGLGGASLMDFVFMVFRRGGVTINIQTDAEDDDESDSK